MVVAANHITRAAYFNEQGTESVTPITADSVMPFNKLSVFNRLGS